MTNTTSFSTDFKKILASSQFAGPSTRVENRMELQTAILISILERLEGIEAILGHQRIFTQQFNSQSTQDHPSF